MTIIATWDNIPIDPALLVARGYNDPLVVDGVTYPRYIGYMAAGIAQVAQSAAAAVTAAAGGLVGSSVTSRTIALGANTITVGLGLGFTAGMVVAIYATASPANLMVATVTAYNGSTGLLSYTATDSAGTGTFAVWTVTLSSTRGPQGTIGLTGNTGPTGNPSLPETSAAIAASNIDLTSASFFTKTIAANTTFTFSNAQVAGRANSIVLQLTNGGAFTVTWWSGIKWNSGLAPTLTVSGEDVLGFYSIDGGTTWRGLVLGRAMA